MRQGLLSAAVFVASLVGAKELPSSTTQVPACTATASSGTGGFFDLRPAVAHPSQQAKQQKTGVTKDYRSRGYDYGTNFTLNICGAVVDPVKDVVGVPRSSWRNVSAHYTSHGSLYSIGSESMNLVSRGRKLVLQYTGGSPCGKTKPSKSTRSATNKFHDDGGPGEERSLKRDDDDKEATTKQKSTTISFLCDRDPSNAQAVFSFVGVSPDECSYFFEARSIHACAGAERHKPGSVGPASVFGLIFAIAVLVYILGGVFYNRAVKNVRGWRQLPNYSLWARIWNMFSDFFIIFCSSCARCLPRRKGYSNLNTSSRGRNSEAENRLIDQLDEEWDD